MPFQLQEYGNLAIQPNPLAKNRLKYWTKKDVVLKASNCYKNQWVEV